MNKKRDIKTIKRKKSANTGESIKTAKKSGRETAGRKTITELTAELNERNRMLERFARILQSKFKELKRLKDKLSASEGKYRALFENMNCGVVVYRPVNNSEDFEIIDFNRAGEQIEKVRRDDIIGKRVSRVFSGVKDFGLFKVFQRVSRTGKPEYLPEALYKDGRDPGTWRENWVYRLPDGNIVAVYSNITEKKLIEEALDETIGSYQSLARNIPGLVYRMHVRENNRMEFFNKMVEVMTGYRIDELTNGKLCSIEPLIINEDRSEVINAVQKAIKSDSPFEIEYRVKRKDGAIRYFLERGRPLIGNDGKPLYIDGVIFDISDKKLAEQALKKSEERYRLLVMNAPDIIMNISAEGTIQFVNRVPAGLSRTDVIGRNLLDFVPDQSGEKEGKRRRSIFDPDFPHNSEMEGISTGRWYNTRIGAVPEDNIEAGITVITRDITERKMSEEMMKNHNTMLRDAVKKAEREIELMMQEHLRYEKLAAVGQISSNIAHEIGNPIGSIRQSVYLLKQEMKSYPDIIKQNLDLIDAEIDRTNNIIKKMMDSVNYTSVKKETTELRHILEQAVSRCRFEDNIKVNITLDPKNYMIWADPLLLQHIFINILTNSKQSISEKGNITIYAETAASGKESGNNHVIEIWDDGSGIDPKLIDSVFTPLFTTKPGATGLGLGICRQIIKNHGGEISIQSRKDTGTMVKILIPAQNK